VLLTRSPLSYPLRGNRVRLACVRHAASVDSEPGSNSHVKDAVPPAHSPACADSLRGFATFNASADDLALRCFVLRVLSKCRIATTLPADTRRVFSETPLRRFAKYLLCLHALSSFQRTEPAPPATVAGFRRTFQGYYRPRSSSSPFLSGSSKEPAVGHPPAINDGIETDSSLSGWRPSGEPFKNTAFSTQCQRLM
jgi:hypothetical protein